MPDKKSTAATAEPEAVEEGQEYPEGALPEEPGQEMVIGEGASRTILVPARYGFDMKQVEAIRRTVAADCSPAELVMFLEIAARYELDPFTKQIFAAKMGGAVQIIVGRDGLLAHAHRQPDFVKMVSDVVRTNDEFEVEWEAGEVTKLRHAYKGFGDRGEIEGAWAMVEREGHGKTYFFAPFKEYKGRNVWEKNPSAMIIKVPETYALRKAFSISGVVGEEEIAYKRADLTALPEEPEWGDDEIMAERLRDLFEKANEAQPGSYRPQKVRTLLAGKDADGRRQIAEDLEAFIDRHTVTDAVVVEEGDQSSDSEGQAEAAEGGDGDEKAADTADETKAES